MGTTDYVTITKQVNISDIHRHEKYEYIRNTHDTVTSGRRCCKDPTSVRTMCPPISYWEDSNWRWPRGCTLQLIPWQCRETHFLWPASSQRLGTAWVLRHASSWEKLWLLTTSLTLPFLFSLTGFQPMSQTGDCPAHLQLSSLSPIRVSPQISCMSHPICCLLLRDLN